MNGDRDLDLRGVFGRVWTRRRSVLYATIAGGLLGIALAMVLPKWYRSTAVILPPEETDLVSNLGVMGRALSKFPALGEFGEYSTPADIYKAILNSRTVRNEVVDRFDLMKVYRQRSRELTLRALDKHTSVRLNPDGTIGVSVEDRDPRRAAAMARATLDALDHYNIGKRATQARRTRQFLERRVFETDSTLRAAESALRRYQESHRTVAPTSLNSSDVTASADLMARKIALGVRLGVLRGYLREDNEQVVQVRRELFELERQIGALPGLQTELAQLMRDARLQEQLYLLLSAELEDARVKETRDTPTVAVLDEPAVPERHWRPRKLIFGSAAAMLALLFSVATISLREGRSASE